MRKHVASGLAIMMIAGAGAVAAGAADAHGIRGSFPHYHHYHGFGYWGGGGYIGDYSAYDDCATTRVPILNRIGVIVGYRYVPSC
jgi:hypothetical protein